MEKPERIIFILTESQYSVVVTVCTMSSILKNLFFLLLKQQNQQQNQQKRCLDTNLSCKHNL